MAVDLGDLIDLLKAEVNAPGEDSFPDAVEDDWLSNLQSAFWETVLDGVVSGYTESDGIVSPSSGSTDLSREMQQLVILYAGIRIVRNKMRTIQTVFRAKAGPVEYETQQAATILREVMSDLQDRRKTILTRLSDIGSGQTFYIDALIARQDSMFYRDIDWLNY